ncbi:Hypothetical protein GLP15_2577 [Giardia lamblia P15]|uniref:C2 DOCK-type domain-containing protein n=1 Tax=Giardia intestinalis (strain P15) TaxID=658858 RepID=E1EXP6_GIAIA|nr:Hypothetical protein GLP15_2577 [Giardia lamblia P15]
MSSSSSQYNWDQFVFGLKASDVEYFNILKETAGFSIQRSPRIPFTYWRVAPHVLSDFRALRGSAPTGKVGAQFCDLQTSDDSRIEPDSNRSGSMRYGQESVSTHRTASSSPISSIRLQIDAPFLKAVEYPHAALDIIRFFLTHPCTIYADVDPMFRTSSALSVLENASKLMRNVPILLDRYTSGTGEQKSKIFTGQKAVNNVPPISILLERLFTEPQLLLELMNIGKITSSDFLFEKISIPPFIKPPVLRMSLSIENLVVGMVNREVMEPFYGSIALYYYGFTENGQHGLYRVSESQYIDMNCLSTLRSFMCDRASPDSKPLYSRLMTILDTIERSKLVEFTIPISSHTCFRRIFLVVFLEKTIGVSSDESHAFYSRIKELEDLALADEKIRSEVDRYSLYLQRLADGVASHDIRVISGIINNKFSQTRHDSSINEAIVSSLSHTLANDNQSKQSSTSSLQGYLKRRLEAKKSKGDIPFSKYPGIDYACTSSLSTESKVPTSIFAAYGKYGEQILAECNKYLPKVRAAIRQTGGLRETFAVSISPIFPLSAFSMQSSATLKRVTHPPESSSHIQGAAISLNPTDTGSTRATFDQVTSTLPDSNFYDVCPSTSNPDSQPHTFAHNISIMGVPRSVARSEESIPAATLAQTAPLRGKTNSTVCDAKVSIQQLENFLLITRIIYSRSSNIKRKDGMEQQVRLQDLLEADCNLNSDADSFVHLQDSDTDPERKELIGRMYRYFSEQKKRGTYSASNLKTDPYFSSVPNEKGLSFVHPLRPISHKLNAFVRLPKNISQTEPLASILLNTYNDRVSKKRALNYVQLYVNTSVNTFGVYDSNSGVFRAIKDAPSYRTLQPNHLPDFTHELELMVWSYSFHLLERGDHDDLLLLLKHGYLTADTLSHLLLFALMSTQGLSSQRIYLTLRDAETTLEHKKTFSSLQSHYFFDRIRGNKLHPNHIYIKQLDCFFRREVGTPAAPFRNRVYLYPQSFIVTLPNARYNAFFLKVEMRSDDALDDKDIMWTIYPRLHGAMTPDDMTKGRIAFRSSYLTSAAVNTRVVRLHDEVKFELPLYITPKTHFLFTLYGVPGLSTKEKSHADKCDLSTIVGVDDTVFVPQEKTATGIMNLTKLTRLYATPAFCNTIDNKEHTFPTYTLASGKMSTTSSVVLHPTESVPMRSSHYAEILESGTQDSVDPASIQHIVEARTQLSLLGYAYLPLVKGVDELGIPVLQNTLGVDVLSPPIMTNSEFIENYDRSISIPFQSQISAGYLSFQADKERPLQGLTDAVSKQTKQVGYVSCTLRYESSLYTHSHFLNAIYYAYTCAKNIVLHSCIDLDKSVKTLRGFCEKINLYASSFKTSRDAFSGNATNSIVSDELRGPLASAGASFVATQVQLQAQLTASKRKSVPFYGESILLEQYGPTYNIAVALASLLMHQELFEHIVSRDLIFNCLEHILAPFTTISNESMAIVNNLYRHCINEELAAAFKAQKVFGKCTSWLMMLRNFIYTPFLGATLAPLFGPTSTMQNPLDGEFAALSDIYQALGGIGNHISFYYRDNSSDTSLSGPFRQDSCILANLAVYVMVAHYVCSITTFQALQNYVSYLHNSIIKYVIQKSSLVDRLFATIPHNFLLIARSFMIILTKYRHLYNSSMSCFLLDNAMLDVSGDSGSLEGTHSSSAVISHDSVERAEFEADLIGFINSIGHLINAILYNLIDSCYSPASYNKSFVIITSAAKLFILLVVTSPKKTKLFSFLESLIDKNDTFKGGHWFTRWQVFFDFLHQLMRERALLYSYSFTDIHARESFTFQGGASDPSDDSIDYTLAPFNLIPVACILPHMYLKALHCLLSNYTSGLSHSIEEHTAFRSICTNIFIFLWEICSGDIARQNPSFLYVSCVPLLLLILDNYNKFFNSVNKQVDVDNRTNTPGTDVRTVSGGQGKKCNVVEDTGVTLTSLSTPRTTMKQSDFEDLPTPKTVRGSPHSNTSDIQAQCTDFTLELLITEMFLFLITFLQRLTNYYTEFLRHLTVEQAQSMLKIYRHVPFLFDEDSLRKRAIILTSSSYRVQSIRYLNFLLSSDSKLVDNIFFPPNNDSVKVAPFLFISPLYTDSSTQQIRTHQKLSSLFNPSKSDSSANDELLLFSEMITDMFMGKVLKYNDDGKLSNNTAQNPMLSFQHTSTYDPYSKADKSASATGVTSSQLFHTANIYHNAHGPMPSGASFGQQTCPNVPYIPRRVIKEQRDSTTSKGGHRTVKKPTSKQSARQAFKISAQISQATLTTSDDTDEASIYRALEDSVDIQESQHTWHKLTHSVVGSIDDPTVEEDTVGDDKEISRSFSTRHREKGSSVHRLTGTFTFTDSCIKPIVNVEPHPPALSPPRHHLSHRMKPSSVEEVVTYLAAQVKGNKSLAPDSTEIHAGKPIFATSQITVDNADKSQRTHSKSTDLLYLKLIQGPDSSCNVIASLLSTLIYESALYQLLSYTQYLIVNSDEAPAIGSDPNSSSSFCDVHAEVIHTFAYFLVKDHKFAIYNEIVLNALVNYFPSIAPILFNSLDNKKSKFDCGISMVIKALLDKIDLEQFSLYSLAATIIAVLLKIEFDYHANTFTLFSMINYSLVTMDLTAKKKKGIISFFDYVRAGVNEICSNDETWINGSYDDGSGLHEMTPISGKVSFICKHFYSTVCLFCDRLLIVIESEYMIKERSKIQSMGSTVTDFDLYAELKLSQADCYVGQVDLRLFSLQSLFNFLKEHRRHVEAGMVSILISGLISEYLIVRSKFDDKVIDYSNLPPVYSLSKIVIPELRKIIPDITVQNDLDVWFAYIAKAQHLMGRSENIYSSLDGGQFFKLLLALQNAATEFQTAKFYAYTRHIYKLLMILTELYSDSLATSTQDKLPSYFDPLSMIQCYSDALLAEKKSYEDAYKLHENVHYYWVSITTENNGKESTIEYIYCCPHSETIREFTERLKRFYDPPDLRKADGTPKINVQKVESYRIDQSAALLTEEEQRIKQRILAQLLSYDIGANDKVGRPEDSLSFLGEPYSNPHLMPVHTEPNLHIPGEVLLQTHADHVSTHRATDEKGGYPMTYYSSVIYNYYPFVLASDETSLDTGSSCNTIQSYASRQIFQRRIQQQSHSGDSSIKLSGCLNVYYYTAHPFPHTNSRQRVIYVYEEYSNPIQEAIRIVEKAIYDTERLPEELNKVFQNLTGIVTPSVNSGTMDIVRMFLKKRNEFVEEQETAIQVVNFDDLVSSTTMTLAEKQFNDNCGTFIAKKPDNRLLENQTTDMDVLVINQNDQSVKCLESSAEADDSLRIFPEKIIPFDDQDRESTSSPTARIITDQSAQKVHSKDLTDAHVMDDVSSPLYSDTGTSLTKTAPSTSLGDSLVDKRKSRGSPELNSDECYDTGELFAPAERLATIKASLKLSMPYHQSLTMAPFNTPVDNSSDITNLEEPEELENVAGTTSSSYFALCPRLVKVFLSDSVYPKLVAKTDVSMKHYRNLYKYPDGKATRALRQGSYLTGDSTHHGSSQESKQNKPRHIDKVYAPQSDSDVYSMGPYGTCRESGYHGRFNVTGFMSNPDYVQTGNELLPSHIVERINVLRNELPVYCKEPNSLTHTEMELCRERLGKLIVKLMNLQAEKIVLANQLMGKYRDYEGLYLLARETFLKTLEELEEYIDFDKERIRRIVS